MSEQSHNHRDDELIHLKRVRQGLEEAPAVEHKEPPKPKGKEAVANFWIYHRLYIILGVVAIILAVSITVSIVGNKRPDITIVAQTGTSGFGEAIEPLEEYFSDLCGDTNGDGVKKADIVDCSYNIESADSITAALQMKLEAQFSENSAVLFIFDDDALSAFKDAAEGNLWVDDMGFKEYNGIAFKLNGTPVEEKYREVSGAGFGKNIYLCVRKLFDKAAESKRGKAANKAAEKITGALLDEN